MRNVGFLIGFLLKARERLIARIFCLSRSLGIKGSSVYVLTAHDMASMSSIGKANLKQETRNSTQSVSGWKRNHCIIFPANVGMTAEALERRNKRWFVNSNIKSDLTIQVGESIFHLHKLPMVARSGYLNRLVFRNRNSNSCLNIQLDNLPGGFQSFKLVVKFCYGLAVDLTATNVAPLYCAAHFLEMNEELEQGNLISKTETFLSFVIFASWKDTIQILNSCESLSSWADKLQIVRRCAESIAWKACTDSQALSCGDDEAQCLNVLSNNMKDSIDNNKGGGAGGDGGQTVAESWWIEDVSLLIIDHFIMVIEDIKRKGMKPGLVGDCISHWAAKWISRVIVYDHLDVGQRVKIESLIRLIPTEKSSVSCNFLLHLLKVSLMINIDPALLSELERRAAEMLESCSAVDLVVKNYGDASTVYDVDLVTRVVEAYIDFASSNTTSRIVAVARVVDEYLAIVARDSNLSVKNFQLLAEAFPEDARYCNDKLYRAIDTYLKAHPRLTEEQRVTVCKAMEYHKLSLEARKHTMKNDRLPMNIAIRFILLEQVNIARLLIADGSDYHRTKSQAFIRLPKGLGKSGFETQTELQIIRQEVERLKVQLNELHLCKAELQRQVNRVF
ncbi:coleoptile phototropism protein 1-like [Telopea speciosissima]|uniref:coleoptile phototropism protein 1-like n=1 Tax=Telopea speciosissima TaxID=54955 RepID=UPI001CC3D980|nr:coleoptile phototropism protein 1-like [Telopea speciosissima]